LKTGLAKKARQVPGSCSGIATDAKASRMKALQAVLQIDATATRHKRWIQPR
jgi:hypothetical protein